MPRDGDGALPHFSAVEVGLSLVVLALLAPLLAVSLRVDEGKQARFRVRGDWAAIVAIVAAAQGCFWATVVLRHRLHELGTPALLQPISRSVAGLVCCLVLRARSGELLAMRSFLTMRTLLAAIACVLSSWSCAASMPLASPAARRVADMLVPLVTVAFLSVSGTAPRLPALVDALLIGGCGALIALPSARTSSGGLELLAMRATAEALTAILQGWFFGTNPLFPVAALLLAQSTLALPLVAFVGHIAHPVLLLGYGLAAMGLCVASMELVRRVGATEAMLLLALTRWPLPLGYSAIWYCGGPVVAALVRLSWPLRGKDFSGGVAKLRGAIEHLASPKPATAIA
jgi:hypothetical protein